MVGEGIGVGVGEGVGVGVGVGLVEAPVEGDEHALKARAKAISARARLSMVNAGFYAR
jgi:hypothetical protein